MLILGTYLKLKRAHSFIRKWEHGTIYCKSHYLSMNVSGWCKSNCSFALLKFAVWSWNRLLNKCGYVMHHLNAHFLNYTFLLMTLLALYFSLDYENDARQKANSSDLFFLSSKWVVKQQRQLITVMTHLAQELLMNIQHNGGSRNFAKEMRVLKMRNIVASHWKLTMTNWEDLEADLLTLYKNFPKSSTLTIWKDEKAQ